MRGLRDAKGWYGSRFPFLQINCPLTASALDDAPRAVEIAAELGCRDVSFGIACIFEKGLEAESLLRVDAGRVAEAFGRCSEAGALLGIPVNLPPWPPTQGEGQPPPKSDSNEFGCRLPWQSMLVRASGCVEVCTYNRKIVGELDKMSVEAIWAGQDFSRFRAGHARCGGVDLCELCYHRASRAGRPSERSHLAFCTNCDGY